MSSGALTPEMLIVNMESGHVLRDTNNEFNDVGDTVVAAATGDSTVECKWWLHDEGGGTYTLRNVGTGRVLGASKKYYNHRGDHHVMCSPSAKDAPSVSKWRWNLLEPAPAGTHFGPDPSGGGLR